MQRVSLVDSIVFAEDDVLLKIQIGKTGVGLAIVRKGKKIIDSLVSDNLVKFVGACKASAIGLGGFNAEVVSKTTINPDKIKLEKEDAEKLFVSLLPGDFDVIVKNVKRGVRYQKVELNLLGNILRLDRDEERLVVEVQNAQGQAHGTVLEGLDIDRFFSALFVHALGRGSPTLYINTSDRLFVKEKVEPKEDLSKELEVKGEKKTLGEWIEHIEKLAKDAKKYSQPYVKNFLRQHGIEFHRKVSVRIREVEVRVPPWWALGLYELMS